MGAWGYGIWDNDDACDWKYGLTETSGTSHLEETLQSVIEEGDEYLDATLACEALAACEVLACLVGRPGEPTSYSDEVHAWVKRQNVKPAAELVSCAMTVIDRIRGEESEWRELWEEAEADEPFEIVADLKARLAGTA